MFEGSRLSELRNIDWHAAWQWYSAHTSTAHLIQNWESDSAFTQHDWLTIALLAAHLLLLLTLAYVLFKRYREARFHAWIENKRSHLTHRKAKVGQTILEAKVGDSPLLKQAYNLHRYAMYDQALEKYRKAFEGSTEDINVYLVGIKIISEMDEPNADFIQFLQQNFSHLREQHPSLWKEVARYGNQKTPNLYQWQPAVN